MAFINKWLSSSSSRIERWFGKEQCESFSRAMYSPGHYQWYGSPILVAGIGADIRVDRHGDFIGRVPMGAEGSLAQYLEDQELKVKRARVARAFRQMGGFGTINDIRSSRKQKAVWRKDVPGTTAAAWNTAWYTGVLPPAGSAAGAAPSGTQFTSASTGAIVFQNADSGNTLHSLDLDINLGQASASVMVYDRLHSVTKTMNSTTTEAVTGTPPRYQSTTQGAFDSAGNNFLMIECRTVLPATAHNWTVCTYTDQSGNAGATLPTVTGVSSCAASRLDQATGTWFTPLATGDTGIQALTQMQCSAAVASGAIDFTIGHPICFAPNISSGMYQTKIFGISSGLMLSRILDNACLALLTWSHTSTLGPGYVYMNMGES